MNLSDLEIFRAVVEEGGVTRAAKRLHRVQSNITTRVRQLEEKLGVDLFIREGRKMHLAPAGQVLIDYADRLLTLAEEAAEAVQDPRPRGLFRLGSMESTASVRLPAPLSEYIRRHPEVTLEMTTSNPRELARRILEGEIDAAFGAEPLPEEPFDRVLAFEEELVIVAEAGHPPLTSEAPPPHTMIAFENGCPHRRRMEGWYAEQGAMPRQLIELGSYHAMLGCIVVGMGAAMIPKSVLSTFPEARRLSVHPLPEGENILRTYLFWRKGAISPKITALIDVLSESAEDRKKAA